MFNLEVFLNHLRNDHAIMLRVPIFNKLFIHILKYERIRCNFQLERIYLRKIGENYPFGEFEDKGGSLIHFSIIQTIMYQMTLAVSGKNLRDPNKFYHNPTIEVCPIFRALLLKNVGLLDIL